ncbi:MAG TPA: hypothetical protein VHE81_18065 [Lacipirellulaceae bacterium]|nr:hypothetical protein [Lacipirellulaceae bacterium]
MIILDTDHFVVLQVARGAAYDALKARMDSSADQDYWTTIITFEEHMRGNLRRRLLRPQSSIEDIWEARRLE